MSLDWDALSSALSPDALQALREHMGNTTLTSTSTSISGRAVDTEDSDNNDVINDGSSGTVASIFTSMPLNAVYKDVKYWDERFKDEKTYDWLLSFDDVKDLIVPHIVSTNSSILIIGCGNSKFSVDLYDAGYTNITNIDFSEVVIAAMREEHSLARPLMKWDCMDMTALTYPDSSFDIVIDKAAMDAIMVDEGDVWNPNEEVVALVDKMCLGINRVMNREHGVHLQISFAQPHFRTKYLMATRQLVDEADISPYSAVSGFCSRYEWTCSHLTIECGGSLPYFFYIMKRM